MTRTTPKIRNGSKRQNLLSIPKIFLATACDLHLQKTDQFRNAYSLLCANKIESFLRVTGAWTEQQYQSSDEHRRWHQLAALLIKYPFEDPSIDRSAAAMKKFMAAEHKCKRINTFIPLLERRYNDPRNLVFDKAKRWIRSVIGEKPNMLRIYGQCGFGPGAALGVHGNRTNDGAKLLVDKITCGPAALSFALSSICHNRHYLNTLFPGFYSMDTQWIFDSLKHRIELVQHNNIVCVPKTAKTDRTIAIEPLWNSYVQKGIDNEIRHLLRRVGLDLTDQTYNQELARLGSLDSSFATIDLSSASDSISLALAKRLLPEAWYDLLKLTRSPSWKYQDNDPVRYHKLTSMGNGFCFPLQTLIFAAVVECAYDITGSKTYSVYGDDIIVEQSAALLVLEYLRLFGFTPNRSKTFIHGPFKESCGSDYYLGDDVRPIYIKEPVIKPHLLYPLLNNVKRKLGVGHLWAELFSSVPRRWRYLQPDHLYYDNAISAEQDLFLTCEHTKWCRHTQTWSWRIVRDIAVSDTSVLSDDAILYGLLRGSYRATPSGVDSRSNTQGYSLRNRTRTQVVRLP